MLVIGMYVVGSSWAAGTCREVCADEMAARRAVADVDASRASAWQLLALTSLSGSLDQWCLRRAMLSWTRATELRQVGHLGILPTTWR